MPTYRLYLLGCEGPQPVHSWLPVQSPYSSQDWVVPLWFSGTAASSLFFQDLGCSTLLFRNCCLFVFILTQGLIFLLGLVVVLAECSLLGQVKGREYLYWGERNVYFLLSSYGLSPHQHDPPARVLLDHLCCGSSWVVFAGSGDRHVESLLRCAELSLISTILQSSAMSIMAVKKLSGVIW